MMEEYQKRLRPKTKRVVEALEQEWTEGLFAREIAERLGCSKSLVDQCRRAMRAEREISNPDPGPGVKRCRRCGFPGWEENPLIDGVCLWCRAAEAGVDLGKLVAEMGWEGVVGQVVGSGD